MRPVALAYLYLRRLRTQPMQELLAGAGIAIGVALAFAVQVAGHSVTGSASEGARSLAGSAALQLRARSTAGVSEQLVERVRAVAGVRRATGVLEQRALVAADGRRAAVHVAGVRLGPDEVGGLLPPGLSGLVAVRLGKGLLLSRAIADELALPPRRRAVTLELRGRATPVPVAAVPRGARIGVFADGPTVLMQREQLQRLAGLPGRVTRVLVQVDPGAEDAVRGRLTRLAADRLTVGAPADEVRLLAQATGPNERATTFFTLIAALVGWLLAFNAMLLTASERRRVIVELRMQGFRAAQLVQITLFQALLLGSVATAVGLVLGGLLAGGVLHESSRYLAGAFTVGTQTIVPRSALLLTFVAGVLAACLAAAPPLFALRRRGQATHGSNEAGQALSPTVYRRMLIAAGIVLVATGSLLLAASRTATLAIVSLALALLLALPAVFHGVVDLAQRASARASSLTLLVLALFGLRATPLRSLALASTGALAVFGSVAMASARDDLLRGIDRFAVSSAASADLWIAHDDDDLATRDFAAGDLVRRLARLPGVADVRRYQAGFVDIDDRRVWLVARPPGDRSPVPASEIDDGDARSVARRLRAGGWITVSDQLARSQGVEPGERLTLPTPTGEVGFRVAAVTSNLGWSAGAIVMGRHDYAHNWGTGDPTALEVDVRPGVSATTVATALRRELGPGSALEVRSAADRARRAGATARDGLSRLGQIAVLLLIGAALAMAAAMSAAIWQRRPALAALRLQSLRQTQLWAVLLAESGVVLLVGCASGALAGVYGQFLMDRYLRLTTGFPAPFALAGGPAIEAIVLVMTMALLGIAIPGWLAARAPAQLALQD